MTAYLAFTSLATVRPSLATNRVLTAAMMMLALVVGLFTTTRGVQVAMRGELAFPFFLFTTFAALGVAGDIGVLRRGPPAGAKRLVRHLWRMCLALFIAALSFFIGQAQVIPEPVRIMPLLALPVLAVLLVMGYWLWRVRFRRSLRGLVIRTSPAPRSPSAA
jgi:hypothetical protein